MIIKFLTNLSNGMRLTVKKLFNFFLFYLQKFKFCGNDDLPDFILAIIHSNLCGLSSIKLKQFASYVVDMIVSDSIVDETKFLDLFDGSIENLKSSYACIKFLLLSAVTKDRFGVSKDIFSIELQQLGLPREHSSALEKVLNDKTSILKSYLIIKSLAVNDLTNVKISKSNGIECVKMELAIEKSLDGKTYATNNININHKDIPLLIKELKIIRKKMNGINS